MLDPAYGEIGPNTCVGMTGSWANYSWPPAIVLLSVMSIFMMDFAAEQYVDRKYGFAHGPSIEDVVTDQPGTDIKGGHARHSLTHNQMHSGDQDSQLFDNITAAQEHASVQDLKDESPASISFSNEKDIEKDVEKVTVSSELAALIEERSFRQQISAFLILEFGVIFHSVIIGLNLGTAGEEFTTLYPVLVFHQSFEGLGIGARMSAIPFPKRFAWLPWVLCAGYGLTTPIAIAIGLGLRTTYNSGSFTASVVSGILDSISAGILIYTGLVELLARDFLFNPELTHDKKRLTFMICCVLLGTGVMALLGKWA